MFVTDLLNKGINNFISNLLWNQIASNIEICAEKRGKYNLQTVKVHAFSFKALYWKLQNGQEVKRWKLMF